MDGLSDEQPVERVPVVPIEHPSQQSVLDGDGQVVGCETAHRLLPVRQQTTRVVQLAQPDLGRHLER